MPTPSRARHFVVNGFDGLAYRLADQLTSRYGADVIMLMTPEQQRISRDFSELPRVKVVLTDRIDERALLKAELATAAGIALTVQDDVGNIHAALQARELVPELRLVIRMANLHLGRNIEQLFGECKVLSDADLAAPALVAAALGEIATNPLPVGGRTLVVARRVDVAARDVVCGLADTTVPNGPNVLPADPEQANLVLAELRPGPVADLATAQMGIPASSSGPKWSRTEAALTFLRTLFSRKSWIALFAILGLIVVAGIALNFLADFGLYSVVVNTLSGPQEHTEFAGSVKALQLLLGVAGLALVPLVTALVVEGMVNARLAVAQVRLKQPHSDHVVVVGLGNVGTRVLRLLHDRNVPMIAIDKDEHARGVQLAQEFGIPLIIGDASRETTLRTAGVDNCRALMTLASNDVINLEAALHGRNLKSNLRVVVRLFDGDLAARVRRTFNIAISRSPSYMAAPAFAEALMDREVIGTIPVERRVLLLAEVVVTQGSRLDGETLSIADRPGEVQVIAVNEVGEPRPQWQPHAGRSIRPLDRLIVVATRDGLSRLIERAAVRV